MKIAVTGFRGRLGSELVRQGCAPFSTQNQEEIDITDPDAIQDGVQRHRPDVLINCASYTKVDECETKEGFDKALRVNFWGIYEILRNFQGRIIHISTDYVFDGFSGPYKELPVFREDMNPVNSYGWTKMGGEMALIHNTSRSGDLLVRTTGLYGRSEHHDFAKLVVKSLSSGNSLSVSHNLYGNQTYIPHLAEALIYISNRPDKFKDIQILNVASKEVINRYEFALMIASVYGFDKRLLLPVKNNQIKGWVATRPTKGGLKVNLAKRLNVPIYRIKDGVEALYGEDIAA